VEHRVIATEQDVEAVVSDLRKRLLGQLKTGARIRLV
jgi:hypothetical protein